MLGRLFRTFGIVSARELHRGEEKLRVLRQQLERATERVAQATAVAEQLQQARREDAQRHKAKVAELEADLERRAARARETADHGARRIAALEEELRNREKAAEATFHEEAALEQRVEAAVQELRVARDALALVDVKLDILEGAANVLDARTRGPRTPDTDGPR